MPRRLVVGWLALAVAACSSAAAPDSTTYPPDVLMTAEEALTSAAEQYAEIHEVSVEVAEEALRAQGELNEASMFLRSNTPGYAGFKFVHEPPEVYGVVAVTDPSQVTLLGHPEIRVVKARIAEQDFLIYDERLRRALSDEGLTGIVGVMYEPFEDKFKIWLEAPVGDHEQSVLDRITEVILEELGNGFNGVGIHFDHSMGRLGG